MALGLTPYQIIEKGTHPQLVIADDWERIELKKIATVQNGYAFSSKLFDRTEGISLIRIRDIFSSETENQYLGEYKEAFVVTKGDILIGMDGDFKVSKWPGSRGILNQRVCRIHFNSSYYEKEFLFICIQPYLNAIHSETSAVTVKHLSSRTINDIPFPLPPLPEQRAIVAKIEELFSALDKGIADLKKAQAQLKIYRQAVLKKAFEGELTKEWREKQLKPEKWKKQLLKNVSSLNPKPIKKKIPSDLEIQFLPMRLVEKVKNKIHLEEIRNFQDVQKKSYTFFEEGDVLFAKVTPCMENGKIAIAKGLKNKMGYGSSEFYVFRVNEKLSNEYLFNFLVQEKFRSDSQHAMTGAVGLKRVPRKFLEDYEIPIPSIREQHQIVQEIESRLSVCDKVEQSISESLEKAQALRQSILKKAFDGSLLSAEEIAACKAAPDYEPASVLLEKIKAEKEK